MMIMILWIIHFVDIIIANIANCLVDYCILLLIAIICCINTSLWMIYGEFLMLIAQEEMVCSSSMANRGWPAPAKNLNMEGIRMKGTASFLHWNQQYEARWTIRCTEALKGETSVQKDLVYYAVVKLTCHLSSAEGCSAKFDSADISIYHN